MRIEYWRTCLVISNKPFKKFESQIFYQKNWDDNVPPAYFIGLLLENNRKVKFWLKILERTVYAPLFPQINWNDSKVIFLDGLVGK